MIKDILKNEKGTFEITWFDSINFSRLEPIVQVYGVLFNDNGEMLIINTTGKWTLPGGGPKKGETFEETLRREVDEEGDAEIDGIIPLGYLKVVHFKDGKKISTRYKLRFTGKIAKIKNQTVDPATGIVPKRKFVSLKEFPDYCFFGKTEKAIIEKAVQLFDSS